MITHSGAKSNQPQNPPPKNIFKCPRIGGGGDRSGWPSVACPNETSMIHSRVRGGSLTLTIDEPSRVRTSSEGFALRSAFFFQVVWGASAGGQTRQKKRVVRVGATSWDAPKSVLSPHNYVEYLSRSSSMTVRTKKVTENTVHFDACVYTSGRCSERCAKSDKR